MRRVTVSPACEPACAACVACRPGDAGEGVPLSAALDEAESPELVLGGGDATRWPFLDELLRLNGQRERAQKIWIEGPAGAFTDERLARLAGAGAHGVVVQIEAIGEAWLRALGLGDGERAIADAERRGLQTQARAVIRPRTFAMLSTLARRLAPRTVWLELLRQDLRGAPMEMPPEVIARALAESPNVYFTAHRLADRGYLPPCAMPDLYRERPSLWRSTLTRREAPNAALPACSSCALRHRCQWNDAGALSPIVQRSIAPLTDEEAAPRAGHAGHNGTGDGNHGGAPVADQGGQAPAVLRNLPGPEVICTAPFTTLEIVDPNGLAFQCCAEWTVGDRGNLHGSSLSSLWNGPGYQMARRAMGAAALEPLCLPICPRLHDRKFSETTFRIQDGAAPFVDNQRTLAEDIAQRREILRARPLYIALSPSTYCNYDCIMCPCGRTPRRDLPESIWEELPAFLPTLRVLTLFGGEPLANPSAMRFMRDFDRARYPDAGISITTNGSLLGESALKHLGKCRFAHVTLSLNAGTAEVYDRVQRGVPLDEVLANLDALMRFRDRQPERFGITLSFVVQPANAHTLIEFGELARARDLEMRLLPVTGNHDDQHIDYYGDPEVVARLLADVDRFAAWAERARPSWLAEIGGTRRAIVEESAARARNLIHPGKSLLRVI